MCVCACVCVCVCVCVCDGCVCVMGVCGSVYLRLVVCFHKQRCLRTSYMQGFMH